MKFPEVTATSWAMLVEFESKHMDFGPDPARSPFLFRGQPNAEWTLSPSLVRPARGEGLSAHHLLAIENAAVEAFRPQAHLYLPSHMIPARQDLISWSILMQHYGAPTRLLDWTESLFVAAYFAVWQQPDSNAAIWIIHPNTVDAGMRGGTGDELTQAEENQRWKNPEAAPILRFVAPHYETDRMGAQQIGITASHQILADHREIIEHTITEEALERGRFAKIIIPADVKPEFLRNLRRMNITARALFPGIDGLGRSIAELVHCSIQQYRIPATKHGT